MAATEFYPRLALDRLREALSDSPVVLVHGPRQCGKTTLVETLGREDGRQYLTLDDPTTLAAIQADPLGFVLDLPGPVTLDEVQRAPELFLSIKQVVDRHREPGRFLLTGSANILFLRAASESLAGRMETVPLHPLSRAEIHRIRPTFLDRLFSNDFDTRTTNRLGPVLAEFVAAGGYPELLRRQPNRRAAWVSTYVEAMVQRDVRDLARIQRWDAMPRLLELAAGQTSRLVNIVDLASPFGLSRPTIRDYLTLLQRVFLVEELPAWHTNRMRRLIKAPKLHLVDTGLACAVLGVDADDLLDDRTLLGQMFETFMVQELRRQAGAFSRKLRFYHYRDKNQVEVDLVLERGPNHVAAVEIKTGATLRTEDRRGLERLRDALGSRFRGGALLYDGETTVPLGDRIHAVPVRRVWEE